MASYIDSLDNRDRDRKVLRNEPNGWLVSTIWAGDIHCYETAVWSPDDQMVFRHVYRDENLIAAIQGHYKALELAK